MKQVAGQLLTFPAIASLPGNGGRGLKPSTGPWEVREVDASLPGNGGRGLKRASNANRHGCRHASLPGNGGRGLKHAVDMVRFWGGVASLPGNGGRGLKRFARRLLRVYAMASLPGNGGRGLKHQEHAIPQTDLARIAPRQREAWIETRCCNAGWNYRNRIAPRQRGAWIETPGRSSVVQHRRIASLPGNGERGLKQVIWPVPAVVFAASLPGNGERGLKPDHQWRLCISQQASLPGNGERGLKHFSFAAQPENRRSIAPRQRRAWIETQPTMRPNWSSSVHRSPATGSVD